MDVIKGLLPKTLIFIALIGLTGFAPSSSTIVDRACQGGKTTVTTQVDDECTKTVTYYGIRAFGLCTGKDTKCKEVTISGPCDVILEEN